MFRSFFCECNCFISKIILGRSVQCVFLCNQIKMVTDAHGADLFNGDHVSFRKDKCGAPRVADGQLNKAHTLAHAQKCPDVPHTQNKNAARKSSRN